MISLKSNRKILILVKAFETISILVKIFGKSRFWSKFSKISILVKIFGKIKFEVNFSDHLDFGEKKWNLDTDYSFRKILIWGQKLSKIPIFDSIFGNYLDFSKKKKKKKTLKFSMLVKIFR